MAASPPSPASPATHATVAPPAPRAPYVPPCLETHDTYANVICASGICFGPGCFDSLPGWGSPLFDEQAQ